MDDYPRRAIVDRPSSVSFLLKNPHGIILPILHCLPSRSLSMHAELQTRLERLSGDLRAGRVDRAALFWLKVFISATAEQGGQVRSDRWIEAGLEAARQLPGLSATALAPRQQL